VDEHVAAAVAFDETVTLGVVEPLDIACDTHRTFPALQWRGAWRRMRPDLPPSASRIQAAADTKKDRECAASAY
jgi:hypothetical protein